MLIERKEKKRKEKKSKGLFYLIFTLTIIAVLTISCNKKTTETSDFMGWDESVGIDSAADFKQFKGKTIRSVEGITTDKLFYFWATFDDNGIKFGQSDAEHKGSLPNRGLLNASPLGDSYTANFTGEIQGTITFTADALAEGGIESKVKSIKVYFQKGTSYEGETFECKFVL